MESTGTYWIPIFNYLETDISVCLTHPKYVNTIKYGRIKKRRSHKKTIIASARIMMVYIYHMVSEQVHFNPTDYTELMDPHFNQPKGVLKDKNVFAYLQSQGYDPSLLVKRSDD